MKNFPGGLSSLLSNNNQEEINTFFLSLPLPLDKKFYLDLSSLSVRALMAEKQISTEQY